MLKLVFDLNLSKLLIYNSHIYNENTLILWAYLSTQQMSELLSRALQTYQEDGIPQLIYKSIQFNYNRFIRPLFPKKVVEYNDVSVRASYLGDGIIPWQTTDIPGYEGALIRGIRRYVTTGDNVVIVGGGWGVSSVAAAGRVGKHGKVITFEASQDAVDKIRYTLDLNDVDNRVLVHHQIVARAISLRGPEGDVETIVPEDLPECDVLVLDCEGAEIDILSEMEIRPRVIIVETHGIFGAPKDEVKDKLTNAGYNPVTSEIAEERWRDKCEKNDIYVIYSEHNES